MSSLRAAVADFLGEDPYATTPLRVRLPLAEAARASLAGAVVPATAGGRPVCVVTLGDGRQFVVPDSCPHDGGLLSDGFVDGDRLVCARHGWEFDVATGQCADRGICLDSRALPAVAHAAPARLATTTTGNS